MGIIRYFSNWIRHDSRVRGQLDCLLSQIEILDNKLNEQGKRLEEFQRKTFLQDSVLNCAESGISDTPLCDEEVIVSLTSYGNRINEVFLPIESIMQGSVKPNRIILWLTDDNKNMDLPASLQKQQKRGLQIEYCKDLRSYQKLIPSLLTYPESCIITIDDDIMYDFDLVENLVRTHNTHPGKVCANRIHKIRLNSEHRPVSYLDWDFCSLDCSYSKLNFLTGVGGALYPPGVFPQEVFNENVFMDICKYADDVWFNAMLMMNNIDVIKSFTHSKDGCDYIEITSSQEQALCAINNNLEHCMNDVQIKKVFEKYNLYHYLLGL